MEKDLIVVIGSSNTDLVMNVERFPKPGETIMGKGFMSNQGGKGANQAVAAARLGARTAFVGKVGSDSLGAEARESLRREKMDVSCLSESRDFPSGTAFIMVDSCGENSIIVNSGANSQLGTDDIDRAEPLLKRARVVLMQLETPVATLAYAASKARKEGAMVVLNPAPAPEEPLPKELLENVDILIPNETEARKIAAMGEDSEAVDAVMAIRKMGVREVVMTLGSKGALAEIDGQMRVVPSVKVKAVDTTAAGDTFCGALCVALSKGDSMEKAVAFANRAASVTVTREGAQRSIPYLEELN